MGKGRAREFASRPIRIPGFGTARIDVHYCQRTRSSSNIEFTTEFGGPEVRHQFLVPDHDRSENPLHPYIYGRRFDPRRLLDDSLAKTWFLRPAGYDLETDRKRHKWVNGKALNRKRGEADQIH